MKLTCAIVISICLVLLSVIASRADLPYDRLADLENICAFIPGDNLDEEEIEPTPDEIIARYNITTNALVQDLKTVADGHGPAETNFFGRHARMSAICWIGTYGDTNDLEYLAVAVTNQNDYAQQSAVGASLNLLKHSPELIPFAYDIVTNSSVYTDRLRAWTYSCLLGRCTASGGNYINDPAQHARIAAFFLERAPVEHSDVLFVDRCAWTLNPAYRHSQQRRDNLAALRPPGLTGRQAELYDAAQADAAQND